MKAHEIISDDEIERVHANANFGGYSKREVVNQSVLKCACCYYQGCTSMTIGQEHGLISKHYKITKKGQQYLWAAFGDDNF